MPNKLFLKIMGAAPHQYDKLKAEEKDAFNAEAQRLLAELQNSDMDAYVELTNSPDEIDEPLERKKRRFF